MYRCRIDILDLFLWTSKIYYSKIFRIIRNLLLRVSTATDCPSIEATLQIQINISCDPGVRFPFKIEDLELALLHTCQLSRHAIIATVNIIHKA